MKSYFLRATLAIVVPFSFFQPLSAQPDYIFKNASLVSGTALQNGAKYKFPSVKTGIDAIITVKSQTGGVTLSEIDNNSTGFDEAFQPYINVSSNSNGYVEFQVDFVSSVNNSLAVMQSNVPVTCIDVDGVTYSNGTLYEQDQVQFFPGYYDFTMTGGNLEVTLPTGWVVMKNTSGFSYDGIDTAAKDVMATVLNKNISSFLLRIGALNTSPSKSEIRYRSVYFQRFNYGHPTPLPNRTMLSLNGIKKQNVVELKGTLSASHSYDKLIIERAISAGLFGYIGEINITGTANAEYKFTYMDINPGNDINYYRVRLVNTIIQRQEISNTLMVKMGDGQKGIEIVNTIMRGDVPVLTIRNTEEEVVEMQITDMSGRVVKIEKFRLYSGTNNINLSGFKTNRGYFVVVLKTKDKVRSQRILVQ
jgi:hypothetical protein